MAQRASTAEAEMKVELGTSDYGTPCLWVVVSFPDSMPYRACRAALLHLAAEIEQRSGDERWVVTIGDVFIAGRGWKVARVELELFRGSTSETEAGLDVLRQAIQEAKRRSEWLVTVGS